MVEGTLCRAWDSRVQVPRRGRESWAPGCLALETYYLGETHTKGGLLLSTLKWGQCQVSVSADPGLRLVLHAYVVNIFQVSPSWMAGGIKKG